MIFQVLTVPAPNFQSDGLSQDKSCKEIIDQ